MNDDLRAIVSYFYDDSYEEAMAVLRGDLARARADIPWAAQFRARWQRLKDAVRDRSLPPGDAFELVAIGGNRVLHENSDEEAYRWLALMIANAERPDGRIDPYV